MFIAWHCMDNATNRDSGFFRFNKSGFDLPATIKKK
jgi:hypothetical protein